MKTLRILLLIVVITVISVACEKAGITTLKLHGDEANLPEQLKGLQVYTVSIGDGEYVKVAILNGQINSATYQVGKTHQTTIIVNKDEYSERTIVAKEIISETKDILVIRK